MASTRLERQGSPTGWKRWLFRAPIGLYRVGLGFIFGRRFVMLEHTGRKSGDTRRTVLETVVDDPDAVYVAAGWGEEAQWLRNVRANPSVVFHLGSRRYRTTAEQVDKPAAGELMARYAEQHPHVLAELAKFMLDDPGDTPQEQSANLASHIPMIRLPKSNDI